MFVLLSVLIALFLGIIVHRFFFSNFSQESNLSTQSTIRPSFVLNNKDLVYQGYFSRSNDQSSVKVIAKLIDIKQDNQQKSIVVNLSPESSQNKPLDIMIDKTGDELPFTLIKQKTRDFDAYSQDYSVTQPDESELTAQLHNHIGKLILIVLSTQKIDRSDEKFSSVSHLIPAYNQYIDCNSLLVDEIQNNTIDAWSGTCQPRTYQIYVVE